MAARYSVRLAGINRAHRRAKGGILTTHVRVAARSAAPRSPVCARMQFHVIHKHASLRERITPDEFHFVDSWG